MNLSLKKMTVCTLAGVMLVTSVPYNVYASASAGVTTALNAKVLENQATAYAGISNALSNYLVTVSGQASTVVASSTVTNTDKQVVTTSKYDNMAVANVNDFVYIRKKATQNSRYTGKLYKNCVAKILDKKNGWYKVESGNAVGWVKASYLKVSAKAVENAGKKVATVTTQTLRVRKNASTDSEVLGLIPGEETLTVLKEKKGWVKVSIEEGNGWVSTDYVKTKIVFKHGESRKEEKARLAKEAAERKAADAAAASTRGSSSSSSSSSRSSRSVGDSGSYSSNGVAVANYACQFVGGRYVWGGTSLSSGVDCSGFVMCVYAAFGVSLPHSSSDLRGVGSEVSVSAMQPGDIICYSGHVAIYIGNNTIVHASNSHDGIKYTSPANYRDIITVRRIF